MRAGAPPAASGSPPAGTVWRLDERDLQALSPAPLVEPPPPPKLAPPPRPNDPPPIYRAPYDPFWLGPYWYWGPGFHYWRRW